MLPWGFTSTDEFVLWHLLNHDGMNKLSQLSVSVSATIHHLAQGRAPQALRALEPKVSFGVLQVSLPYPRGGLRRCHMFILPHPIYNYVHKIILQFYVSFYIFIPHVVSYFLHVSPLIRVVQSYRRQICLRYL
jgi:hypothetical protein